MKSQIVKLSDKRSMARASGKTLYIRCIVSPAERDNPMPGEYRFDPGTYEVDDGENAKRVSALDEQGAISAFYAEAIATAIAGNSLTVRYPSPGQVVIPNWSGSSPGKPAPAVTDPRIVSVTSAGVGWVFTFDDGIHARYQYLTVLGEADAVRAFDSEVARGNIPLRTP